MRAGPRPTILHIHKDKSNNLQYLYFTILYKGEEWTVNTLELPVACHPPLCGVCVCYAPCGSCSLVFLRAHLHRTSAHPRLLPAVFRAVCASMSDSCRTLLLLHLVVFISSSPSRPVPDTPTVLVAYMCLFLFFPIILHAFPSCIHSE